MATLNGRVHRLEGTLAAARGPGHCRACGLRHVRPLTVALICGVLRVQGGTLGNDGGRPTPLCRCACCTDDPGDRWFGALSHAEGDN